MSEEPSSILTNVVAVGLITFCIRALTHVAALCQSHDTPTCHLGAVSVCCQQNCHQHYTNTPADIVCSILCCQTALNTLIVSAAGQPMTLGSGSWPQQGHLQFCGVHLRYERGAPFALAGVSFELRPRQKVGICGRTGRLSASQLGCNCTCYKL